MNQMYRVFASGTSYSTINPNLQPMTNFGQEIGFDFEWKGFTLSGTYFNNNLNYFIDYITVCNTSPACARPMSARPASGPTSRRSANTRNVGNATFQRPRTDRDMAAVRAVAADRRLHPDERLSHQFGQSDAGADRRANRAGTAYMFTAGVEWRPIETLV